jgi:hypothetical protein
MERVSPLSRVARQSMGRLDAPNSLNLKGQARFG